MKLILLIPLVATSLFAKISLDLNSCYGSPTHIVIDGEAMNFLEQEKAKNGDKKFKNFTKKFSDIFLHKAQENKKIVISLDKFTYEIKTDDEGYFEFEAKTQKPFFSHKTDIKAYMLSENITNRCTPIIMKKSQKVGVIADFDDTLIKSDVTKKLNLFKRTFFKNYKQRVLIKGMSKRIKKALGKSKAFFVITGSPKQFSKAINNFLNLHNFPQRVVITKKYKGKNADPLFDQYKYKYQKIKKLIVLYPQIRWTMFGDSGEKDLQVYRAIAKEYPQNVNKIYIRDIKSGKINKIVASPDYTVKLTN